jgi:hypothetical protein
LGTLTRRSASKKPMRLRRFLSFIIIASLVVAAAAVLVLRRGGGSSEPTAFHWTAKRIADDVSSVVLPAFTYPNTKLKHVRCTIESGARRAECTGLLPKTGGALELAVPEPTVRVLLRPDGTWDPICWPSPSVLCDAGRIRSQKTNPLTD